MQSLRNLDAFRLADLEAIRIVLRGGSVIDWHRLNFQTDEEIDAFIRVQEFDPDDPKDLARIDAIRDESISYLRRHFDFPIPKPVAQASLKELLRLTCSKGHRQLCACTILKTMHIIHHLQARELLFMLPVSDQEVFQMVEEKVYKVIGSMLARGFPITEFIGGRKNKDSLYTKLLSKQETVAAQVYDKLRFRIVTRSEEDLFPTLNYLTTYLFPFNYIIPGQSTNTLLDFWDYCETQPRLRKLMPDLQLSTDLEEKVRALDNRFTASSYKVMTFVVDLPICLKPELLEQAPAAAEKLGRVIFSQTEFQVIDRTADQSNEIGDASHTAYKHRQKHAVMRRLKLGLKSSPNND
ncbi:MAG: TIGR04552 family protein [Myxococcales bacterium]|nr:TIGR04552 family protein [Myxococcales bacterium]MCB9708863.1 TIGR04552 family protein [Myxococcales bacterium]